MSISQKLNAGDEYILRFGFEFENAFIISYLYLLFFKFSSVRIFMWT